MAKTLKDAIYGEAVGDALGVPFEFKARDTFTCTDMVDHSTHNQPAGTWSDDTSMALAVCDSYRELGSIDPHDIQSRFKAWYQQGAYTVDGLFDIGNTTVQALRLGHGLAGERDNGNGSLMRTVPLAFMDATDDDVRAVSAITHAHKTSTGACVSMVHIARRLVRGQSPKEACGPFSSVADKPASAIRSGSYVLDTFNAAIWCLLTTSTYAECVLEAVNLGNDTDTTAAVAGALAGIVYGIEGIPKEWVATLRGKDVIDACLP